MQKAAAAEAAAPRPGAPRRGRAAAGPPAPGRERSGQPAFRTPNEINSLSRNIRGAATALRTTFVNTFESFPPGTLTVLSERSSALQGDCTEVASLSGAALGPVSTQELGCTGEMYIP